MTKRDSKALGQYIRWIADEIGLRDWTLHLLDETADEDCNAQTRLIFGRKLASIRVATEFRELEPERIRQTIVHELVHCHFAAATNQVEHDLSEHLGSQASNLFFAGFLRNLEYGVDAVAGALAPHMPLIDWGKPDART